MSGPLLREFEEAFVAKREHPAFRPGDSLRVYYKIEESVKSDKKDKKNKNKPEEKKFRIQLFEGVCLRYKKGTTDSTFSVRKVGANGVGVERVFPFHSPSIDHIEVTSRGRVRRSRLYYLRELYGKAARIQARRTPRPEAKKISAE